MSWPISPDSDGAPGQTSVVTDDLHCRVCGYNLRGLPRDGFCPECGEPVSHAHGPPLLRYADRKWVAALALGVRLLLFGGLSTVFGVVLLAVVGEDADLLIPPGWISWGVGAAGGLLLIGGAELVTRREPGVLVGGAPYGMRMLLLIAALAWLGSNTIDLAYTFEWAPVAWSSSLYVAQLLFFPISALIVLLSLGRLSCLAARTTVPAMETYFGLLQRLLGVAYAVHLIVSVIFLLDGRWYTLAWNRWIDSGLRAVLTVNYGAMDILLIAALILVALFVWVLRSEQRPER